MLRCAVLCVLASGVYHPKLVLHMLLRRLGLAAVASLLLLLLAVCGCDVNAQLAALRGSWGDVGRVEGLQLLQKQYKKVAASQLWGKARGIMNLHHAAC